MSGFGDRIIVLIDMDCFFCQVEVKLNPSLQGKPLAVVQYGSFGPSAIIAVNYEARDYGVTRHMKGPEAKEKCPDIVLVTVPPIRNKPDTGRYRTAGREVIEVLKKHCSVIERASVDEAYLDITSLVDERISTTTETRETLIASLKNTFIVGYCDDDSNNEEKRTEGVEKWINEAFEDLGDVQARKLAIAGILVEEFRAAIWSECQYRCSAGISYNKILAKLACGLHKPNRQTILPTAAVPGLYASLPVNKVRNLGGKFGNIVMESLGCNVMADVLKYSLQELQRRFDEKTGSWLFNIARGIDHEPVTNRLICKSIGSSKNFPGRSAITKLEDLKRWVGSLVEEIVERLEQDMEENERRATQMTLSYHWYEGKKVVSQSKSCPLRSYKAEKIGEMVVEVITKATQKPVAFIGMSAGKFVEARGSGNFVNFFKSGEGGKFTKEGDLNCKTLSGKSEQRMSCSGGDGGEKSLDFDFFRGKEKNFESKVSLDDKKSSFLGNLEVSKTLDSESFKNSFFMNILKDSGSAMGSFGAPEGSKSSKKRENLEIIGGNEGEKGETESPDFFDDCEDKNEVKKDNNSALAQLKDIFPDLNNIDNSVLQLLPIELQREAHSYLKSMKTSTSKNEVKSVTKSKGKPKSSVPKIPIKNGIMKNFFVNNSSNSGNDSPRKKCSECNQMIIIDKFQEHCDFHVAENLQRMINNSGIRNNSKSPVAKRKLSDEIEEPNKRARDIQSFFS